ncbi:MAG: bifunctional NAD(P)H-hydrate repair enzyme Nnr [Armatimonadota bacterium]|nr:MAG: bifunctional NAD(P)H-hydrate repair enzyme Nnr [Armatimonadota bacterium]
MLPVLVTAEEMREMDRLTIEDFGILGLLLMENAGFQVVNQAERRFGGWRGKRVLVLCGGGNNGGDGMVVARHAAQRGAEVQIVLAADLAKVAGDALTNLQIVQKLGLPLHVLHAADELASIWKQGWDLVVDALLGIGVRGEVRGLIGEVIRFFDKCSVPVVAVDVPSGIDADTGAVCGCAIRAALTVTFGAMKVGLALYPGAEYAGEVVVADIGIPETVVEQAGVPRRLITREQLRDWLPVRPPDAHKGRFGHVLVVGGSVGLAGAPMMAAEAALRVGAGLCSVAVPRSIYTVAANTLREAMVHPLPDAPEGCLSPKCLDAMGQLLERANVLAIGPGWSTHSPAREALRKLLSIVRVPCVIDADALNCLALEPDLLPAQHPPLVLTPHPGEMARLMNTDTATVQANRLESALQASRRFGAVVALKGARTVVATPEGRIWVNPTGNAGMATGGSGDVLTGVVAGLLAQGLDAEHSAAAGVYIHGLAGDLAAQEVDMAGLIASDIIRYLPRACESSSQEERR